MLYTGKGDNGTTKLFNCPQGKRISKSDSIFESLGTVDELNSSLGYAKALSCESSNFVYIEGEKVPYEKIIEQIQESLFCIQAKLGGSNINLTEKHIQYIEKVIYEIETLLPPIKSFIIPGGGKTGAYLDICRTIARRSERQLVLIYNKDMSTTDEKAVAFMNRLSSILYALARFANYQDGYYEKKPNYN